MCVPDLLGTQGTFTLFTTRPAEGRFKEGGARVQLRKNGRGFEADLEGPPNSLVAGEPTLTIPLSIRADENRARINVNGSQHTLEVGKLSEWITLAFPAAPLIKVSGICRMLVTEMGEHVSLYVTPINIDPESPAMPISHPSYYSTYLAKKVGQYSTLGLAEDTWALNEGRDRRRHVPAADLRHRCGARTDVLRRPRQAPPGSPCVCLRCDRSHPAHVLALYRPFTSGRARARDGETSRRHRGALQAQ